MAKGWHREEARGSFQVFEGSGLICQRSIQLQKGVLSENDSLRGCSNPTTCPCSSTRSISALCAVSRMNPGASLNRTSKKSPSGSNQTFTFSAIGFLQLL